MLVHFAAFGDWGYDVFGYFLVTTGAKLAEKPDEVRAFTAATVKAVKYSIDHPEETARIIDAARRKGRKVGICGQAPSDFPEFAAFLVEQGIDSISLIPDSLLRTSERVLQAEQQPRPPRPSRRATDVRRLGGTRRPVAEPAAAWADTEPFVPGAD